MARATQVQHRLEDWKVSRDEPLAPSLYLNLPFCSLKPREKTLDEATAEKIAKRCLELGADHAFHRMGRCATDADRKLVVEEAKRQGHTDVQGSVYGADKVTFVYLKGPVEEAFAEFDADPTNHADLRAVDAYLEPLRDAAKAAERLENIAARTAKIDALFAEVELSPAAQRHIRKVCAIGEHGARAPERADTLHDWFKRVFSKTHDQWGKALPAWAPEPSGYHLRIGDAIKTTYVQDSYADHSETLIPLRAEAGADKDALQRNLNALAKRLDTHTGWAGSGSSYSFGVHVEDDGAYALMSARHSIAD